MTPNQPNILLILVDDLGWTDLACCGSEFYETPNLDRLCAEGMRFTDAYAAAPVCSPTRASLLTGKYPATVGITDWIDWQGLVHPARGAVVDVPYLKDLPASEHSLAAALSDAGYATWHVGKWHLGGPGHLPEDHGFEVNIGGCHRGSPGAGGYFSPWTIEALAGADVPEGTYLTDHLTDRAVDLIRRAGERPFFLNLWYYSVHTPIQAKAETVARYEDKAKGLGLDRFESFAEGEPFPCEHKGDQQAARNAGARLTVIDTAPHASDAALAAARAADLILIPCKPSVADLAAISASVDIARMAGKATMAVLNQATVGSTLIAEARDAIAGYGIACAAAVVHHRLDHVRAFTDGLTAEEYAPRGKAASEIGELWAWIRSQGDTTRGESQ